MIRPNAPASASDASSVSAYEDRLKNNFEYAMSEIDSYFHGRAEVQKALKRIVNRLDEIGVDYALCGGLALARYGYIRATDDVDLLVTPEHLKLLHDRLEGLGYVPPFAGSKNLRDTDAGVKIDFLISGQYPGDGKPKPVAFPHPIDASDIQGEIRVLRLERLIELKLASGLSAPHRAKDITDVLEVIRALSLDEELAGKLDPSVRDKYVELVGVVRNAPPDDH